MKKKLSILTGLLLISLVASAFSLKEWQESVYEQIRSEALKELKKAVRAEVSIGGAEGIVVGQIIFKDVSIAGFARAEKVYLNFNPIELALKKNFVAALSKITIQNAEFEIAREEYGQLNLLKLLPPEEPGAPPPPPLRAKISFKNCRVNYRDPIGFRKKPKAFSGNIQKIEGEINLRRENIIYFAFSGNISQELKEAQFKASGFSNLKTGKYEINLKAEDVDLERLGNYTVPVDALTFAGGEADLILKITPPQTQGWPFSLVGNFSFHNASLQIADYKIEKGQGNLSMADERLAFKDLTLHINQIPIEINGRFFDFTQQNLDLNLSLKNASLKNLASAFPQTKGLDAEGMADVSATVQGTLSSPEVAGKISIQKGRFYNQAIEGQVAASFKQNLLEIIGAELVLYQGRVVGAGIIDFTGPVPELSIKTSIKNINLSSLAQDSPAIVGKLNGKMDLSGPVNNLKGDFSAELGRAAFFGQEMERILSSFHTQDGHIYLERFSATSKTATLLASGEVSRDLNFDFEVVAQGIRLSGKGILGEMRVLVEFFRGNVSWKLDEKFLASPLKNLKASGEINLSQGKIGEQQFDRARGKLTAGEGLIQVENISFTHRQSVLRASGQTGIGYPTRLTLSGEKIDLADLKILNYILPEELKDPAGQVDIKVEITGEISEETKIASLDPLLDLLASGKIALKNVKTTALPVLSQGILNFRWEKRRLAFSDSTLKTPQSDFTFDLSFENQNKIKANVTGVANLSEYLKFTRKYGRLDGKLGLNLILEGKIENPMIAASFWLLDFQFNNIFFDEIKGNINYAQDKIILSHPLLFSKGTDRYELSGSADLAALRENQFEESNLDLNLRIIQADLPSLLDLSEKLRGEISRRLFVGPPGGKSKINLAALHLPTIQQYIRRKTATLYAKDGEKEYFLKTWGGLLEAFRKEAAAAPEENLGGKIQGGLSLTGKVKNLSGEFTGQVKEGFFKNFNFDLLALSARLKEGKIEIEELELFKKPGGLLVRGEIDFEGNTSLDVLANRMPMDFFKIFIDQELKGTFNMNASLKGPILDPVISAVLAGNDLTLAGVHFQEASISVTKKNGSIFIHEFSLLKGKNLSKISGFIMPNGPGRISLKGELKDEGIGLLNLFTNEMRWIKGRAQASINIEGSLKDPQISGEIYLKENLVYVKALDSEIKQIEGEATIKNSLLHTTKLTGIWQGERTRDYPNFLGVAGTIDLKHLFTQRMVYLNLSASPYPLYIAFPNLYVGSIDLKGARLYGPFYIDPNAGEKKQIPTLSGNGTLRNALITISPAKGKQKMLPLKYDLNVSLEKNVYAVMGDIATFDLSNILANLEIRSEALKISGTSLYPSFLGKITITRGLVNIFNREFVLLSTDQQEKYFAYDREKIKENIALFTGKEGEEGTQPEITITAKVDVENIEEDASGQLIKKKITVLSRLQGVIGATQRNQGLTVSLYSFIENGDKAPQPAGYSEQEIRVMLLPDFIKSLTGISKGEEVDTNLVLADYISSRFQTFVFRGVERELEQKLGLESLTLEYNFGKDIRQAMGVTETRILEGERPDWRVGFVKGFFDKFYVDVNYAQFGTATEVTQNTFNYQLTYKLSRIWSIIYYREPISLQEPISGYEKYTLRAGFSFW